MLLDEVGKFDGFGPCRLNGGAWPAMSSVSVGADRRENRRRLRAGVPRRPGVYGVIDVEERLVYVGKSKSLCDRLLSYFSASAEGTKAGRIAGRAARIVWEPHPHELAALLRELELIRRFRPRWNVQGQPGRRGLAWLCLGRGPAACAYLAARPGARADAVFGPLPAGRRAREAVRLVNDSFGLRDCPREVPIAFSDQRELFAAGRAAQCLRHALGTCLAPCAGACSRVQYEERARAARRFLDGSDLGVVANLEAEMQRAAGAGRFGHAAYLRDRWRALSALAAHLGRIRDARERHTFVYPAGGVAGADTWFFLRQGEVAAACPAPATPDAAEACLRLMRKVYGRRRNGPGEQLPEDLEAVLVAATWFRRHPEELRQALRPRAARRLCRQVLAGGAVAVR